jgi:two-component system, chemotaxis family, chemotaxis protein CheY
MSQKILVVDDDLFIRELYSDILTKAGYEVDLAEDGEIGLSKMQKNLYSMILLDMNMPILGGLGVLDKIKNSPELQKNGSIVLLTNSGDDAQVQEGIQKGAVSSMVKAEMTPGQLLENIAAIIK